MTLGEVVRDRPRRFTREMDSRLQYLYGCDRWSIEPLQIRGGKAAEAQYFDEEQLEGVMSP